VIGAAYEQWVMLHDDHGVPLIAQFRQRIHERLPLGGMQPRVALSSRMSKWSARCPAARQPDALRLSAESVPAGPRQMQVAQPHLLQEAQAQP